MLLVLFTPQVSMARLLSSRSGDMEAYAICAEAQVLEQHEQFALKQESQMSLKTLVASALLGSSKEDILNCSLGVISKAILAASAHVVSPCTDISPTARTLGPECQQLIYLPCFIRAQTLPKQF